MTLLNEVISSNFREVVRSLFDGKIENLSPIEIAEYTKVLLEHLLSWDEKIILSKVNNIHFSPFPEFCGLAIRGLEMMHPEMCNTLFVGIAKKFNFYLSNVKKLYVSRVKILNDILRSYREKETALLLFLEEELFLSPIIPKKKIFDFSEIKNRCYVHSNKVVPIPRNIDPKNKFLLLLEEERIEIFTIIFTPDHFLFKFYLGETLISTINFSDEDECSFFEEQILEEDEVNHLLKNLFEEKVLFPKRRKGLEALLRGEKRNTLESFLFEINREKDKLKTFFSFFEIESVLREKDITSKLNSFDIRNGSLPGRLIVDVSEIEKINFFSLEKVRRVTNLLDVVTRSAKLRAKL